jgi:oxalyl-CoA decarboxylase
VMLVGARLNWLLGHGEAPQWSPDATIIQVDISATELDSNQAIAAPLVGDVGSVMEALVERSKPGQITVSKDWRDELAARSAQNVAKMAGRIEAAATAHPMKFVGAPGDPRRAGGQPGGVHHQRGRQRPGPGTQHGRHAGSATPPRQRHLGCHGHRHGLAIAAAIETGKPVIAIEGDSAFGLSGIGLETICSYNLPIVTVILNNSGVYRGDDVSPSADPAPAMLNGRHDLMIEAGFQATTPTEVAAALREALASGGPALVDCVINPRTEPRAATSRTSIPRASPSPDEPTGRNTSSRPPTYLARSLGPVSLTANGTVETGTEAVVREVAAHRIERGPLLEIMHEIQQRLGCVPPSRPRCWPTSSTCRMRTCRGW